MRNFRASVERSSVHPLKGLLRSSKNKTDLTEIWFLGRKYKQWLERYVHRPFELIYWYLLRISHACHIDLTNLITVSWKRKNISLPAHWHGHQRPCYGRITRSTGEKGQKNPKDPHICRDLTPGEQYRPGIYWSRGFQKRNFEGFFCRRKKNKGHPVALLWTLKAYNPKVFSSRASKV